MNTGKKFVRAMTTGDTFTENMMITNSTSSNNVVDLFFKMGGSRQNSDAEILSWFQKSFSEDRLLTLKAAFYNRDVREGQGERKSFRIFFSWLANSYPEIAQKNLILIPEYGRWDDLLFVCENTYLEKDAFAIYFKALEEGNKLAAKWAPRENKKFDALAKKMIKFAGLTPKEYRKLLSKNTEVVENLMCKNLWEKINYKTVPSVAMHKYRKAFFKHDNERITKFLEKVLKGEETVHASAIFPHDIIKPLLTSQFFYAQAAAYYKNHNYKHYSSYEFPKISAEEINHIQAQWMSLPNYFGQTHENILPVCDVSGSMQGLPMEVSLSLGLYISERNTGPYKDVICTFSGHPDFVEIKGKNIYERLCNLSTINWDQNTNLEAVFNLILSKGKEFNLEDSEMPHRIIILSDMQFDQCIVNPKYSAYELIKSSYRANGYKLPQIIFWNLRTSSGIPAKFDERGTALVSGFSPSILKNILSGELEPERVMLKTLNSERYSQVTL